MKPPGVVVCSDSHVFLLGDDMDPGYYAGCLEKNIRVYIAQDARLSDEARAVLNAHNVQVVERIEELHKRRGASRK